MSACYCCVTLCGVYSLRVNGVCVLLSVYYCVCYCSCV